MHGNKDLSDSYGTYKGCTSAFNAIAADTVRKEVKKIILIVFIAMIYFNSKTLIKTINNLLNIVFENFSFFVFQYYLQHVVFNLFFTSRVKKCTIYIRLYCRANCLLLS